MDDFPLLTTTPGFGHSEVVIIYPEQIHPSTHGFFMAQFIWKEWYVEKGVFKDVEASGVQHLNSNMEAPNGLKHLQNMSGGIIGIIIMVHFQIDGSFKGNVSCGFRQHLVYKCWDRNHVFRNMIWKSYKIIGLFGNY